MENETLNGISIDSKETSSSEIDKYKSSGFKSLIKFYFNICKYAFISFLFLSILITFFFSFIRPPKTYLMTKRHLEYKKDGKDLQIRYQWIPIEKISPYLIQAVVSTEDNHFTKHYGIDFGAVKKAKKHNLYHKRKRGASTITQQTAKNVFLWPKRNYLRKGLEVYFSILIETFWSKKRIMEVYLNMIEMGPHVYGAEAASRYYFHKSASRLSRGEAALIAISLPSPRKRNPSRPGAYMYQRQQRVLSLMRKIGEVRL